VVATFEDAVRMPRRSTARQAVPAIHRAELLCDYDRTRIAASSALQEDTVMRASTRGVASGRP
jgi:hypothetical protein